MSWLFEVEEFEQWQQIARQLLASSVPPDSVGWRAPESSEYLIPLNTLEQLPEPPAHKPILISKQLLQLIETASFHRSPKRWNLLYRLLWRTAAGERKLLELVTDDDVIELRTLEKEVRRDCHKMKAFVRFRKVEHAGDDHFVAWHRPDHRVVKRVAPFFARRFKAMHWTIFTPHESANWDTEQLTFGAGVPRSAAPGGDELEEYWKTYYSSIFNPARIKISMMKSEMPVRHWPTLPETELIEQMLLDAPKRVETMVAHVEGLDRSASDFLPANRDLTSLNDAARSCRGCELCQRATQTVFGEGTASARLMVVGEQPGDQEDIAGKPFVGPAGQMLDRLFQDAGIDRRELYLTNAVKHFSFVERGQHRLHKKPSSREINACRPWLSAEIGTIRPRVIVCLGATALQTIAGRQLKLKDIRGTFFSTHECSNILATWHPASILRVDGELARQRFAQVVQDLQTAAGILRQLSPE